MLFFDRKKHMISKMMKSEYGQYLNFVESMVYEIEGVIRRANRKIRDIKVKYYRRKALILLTIFSLNILPFILLNMALMSKTHTTTEIVIYAAWILFGLHLLHSNIYGLSVSKLESESEVESINLALGLGIAHAKSISDSFYSKKDSYDNVFNGIAENDLENIGFALNKIEMDLEIFSVIHDRNIHLNKKPMLKDDAYYQLGREGSQNFLNEYFEYHLSHFAKIN